MHDDILTQLDNAHDHDPDPWDATIHQRAAAEIRRLREWKTDTLQLLNKWTQVWEQAGKPGTPGQPLHQAVLHELQRLQQHQP